MFRSKVILISGLGLLIAYFISSTSAGKPNKPEKPTTMRSLVKITKSYFKKVKQMDTKLKKPKAMSSLFWKVRYWSWFRSIECTEKYKELFREQYSKFVGYAIAISNDYETQINAIKNRQEDMGDEKGRSVVCTYFTNEFLPKLKIVGSGCVNDHIKTRDGDLRRELRRLHDTIIAIRDSGRPKSNPAPKS